MRGHESWKYLQRSPVISLSSVEAPSAEKRQEKEGWGGGGGEIENGHDPTRSPLVSWIPDISNLFPAPPPPPPKKKNKNKKKTKQKQNKTKQTNKKTSR